MEIKPVPETYKKPKINDRQLSNRDKIKKNNDKDFQKILDEALIN